MIWILIAVIFAAGEVASLSFFLAPFAVGALLGRGGRPGGAVDGRRRCSSSSSARPCCWASCGRSPAGTCTRAPQIRTGTAALVGKTALVTQQVDDRAGAVKLDGEVWTARTYVEGDVIEVGRKVHVVEIRGATALVSDTE